MDKKDDNYNMIDAIANDTGKILETQSEEEWKFHCLMAVIIILPWLLALVVPALIASLVYLIDCFLIH